VRRLGKLVLAALGIRVGGSAARLTARAAVAHRRNEELEPGVPAPAPSAGLFAASALDALAVLPLPLLSSTGTAAHYRASSAEVDEAVRSYDRAGWLDDPSGRHPAPTSSPDVRAGDHGITFASGWQPQADEPGADRWRGFTANDTVPVTLLQHEGEPRPWLVLVHGQGMGRPSDPRMLSARFLHESLGINVALPVLPLHGPRSAGLQPHQQFVSNVYPVNNVLGLTQAVWDLRRLMMWLREAQGAPAIGALGVSLGSYACSLLATQEPHLACVVGVVPTSDLARSLAESVPAIPSRRHLHRALHDERSALVHRVVSPLRGPCLVPFERRHLVAGVADRIAPPSGAVELWRHWGEPDVEWRPRGHLTTWQSAAYRDHVGAVLAAAGLVHRPVDASVQ
jgi:hypothetical protein